jgi:NAD+ diphosphatase
VGDVPRAERFLRDLALARGALDRRAELRGTPELVERLLAEPSTRVLDLVDDRAPVDRTDSGPVLRLRAPGPGDTDGLVVLLGVEAGPAAVAGTEVGGTAAGGTAVGGTQVGGTAYLAVVRRAPAAPMATAATAATGHDPAGAGADDDRLAGLRTVGASLPGRDAGLFATALALANWHATHGHCPRCGTATTPALAGWIRRCPRDGSEHYPRTDPAVIMAVVDDDDRLLLARGAGFTPRGMSVLAGFVEPGESLAAAVEREVAEEVGVGVRDVTYVGDQPWPFPSSLMVGFTARATSTDLRPQVGEIEEARWFSRAGLRSALDDGTLRVPPRVSIARRLVEQWYGAELDVPDTPVRPR